MEIKSKTWERVSPNLLILGAFVLLSLMYSAASLVTEPIPVWSQPQQETELLLPLPYNLSIMDAAEFTPVSGLNGQMPDPPRCGFLKLTRCRWEVTERPSSGEGHVIDVKLLNGAKTVGEVQLMEIPSAYAPELAANVPADTVWIAFVRVARFARGNGIGRTVWLAGDSALRYLSGQDGTNTAYRAIYDLAGWAESLLSQIPPESVIYVAEDAHVIIYAVR